MRNEMMAAAMREKGFSTLGLARATGIARSTIARYLNGARPREDFALKLSETLGASQAKLFGSAR